MIKENIDQYSVKLMCRILSVSPSGDYQKLMVENGFICSMSKRGDCYDNASMESWNHSFKVEAIHGEKFLTRADAKSHVLDYIDVYYNRKRLHSRLGYQSPVYFETQNVA